MFRVQSKTLNLVNLNSDACNGWASSIGLATCNPLAQGRVVLLGAEPQGSVFTEPQGITLNLVNGSSDVCNVWGSSIGQATYNPLALGRVVLLGASIH